MGHNLCQARHSDPLAAALVSFSSANHRNAATISVNVHFSILAIFLALFGLSLAGLTESYVPVFVAFFDYDNTGDRMCEAYPWYVPREDLG